MSARDLTESAPDDLVRAAHHFKVLEEAVDALGRVLNIELSCGWMVQPQGSQPAIVLFYMGVEGGASFSWRGQVSYFLQFPPEQIMRHIWYKIVDQFIAENFNPDLSWGEEVIYVDWS